MVLNYLYDPNKNLVVNHLECLDCVIAKTNKNFDSLIFLGDFKASMNNDAVTSFCFLTYLTILIDHPTCYKNSDKHK